VTRVSTVSGCSGRSVTRVSTVSDCDGRSVTRVSSTVSGCSGCSVTRVSVSGCGGCSVTRVSTISDCDGRSVRPRLASTVVDSNSVVQDLLEKFIVSQLVKKYPSLVGTIIVFIKSPPLDASLSQINPVYNLTPNFCGMFQYYLAIHVCISQMSS